jgi:regulator of RNase E activity RraB
MYAELLVSAAARTPADHRSVQVTAGFPSRMGDSRVLQHSSLWDRCEHKQILHPSLHLVGDSAYSLKVWLMKNFPRGNATADQRVLNSGMNSCRARVEHAHALFKNRWRRMHMLDFDVSKFGSAILCCALLHNICLKASDLWTADDEAEDRKAELDAFDAAADGSSSSSSDDDSDSDADSSDDEDEDEDDPAKAKRLRIMRELVRRRNA